MIRFVLVITFATSMALAQDSPILRGNQLAAGLDVGVDTNLMRRDWLTSEPGQWKLNYPTGQAWGAVFVTVGSPKDPPRPSMDLSARNTLLVEMRAERPGTRIEVGVKDNTQRDNGSETKVTVSLGTAWTTHSFRLDLFSGADIRRLYVLTEFVFAGAQAQTIYVRSIKFVTAPAMSQTRVRNCDPEPTNMEIASGDLVDCAIDSLGDSDLFHFQAVEGEKVMLEAIRKLGSNADQCFRVSPPGGAFGPYSCVATNGTTGVRATAVSLTLTVSQSGVHTIQIVDGSSNETLSYTLGLFRLFPAQSNTPNLATGVVTEEEIVPLGDVDSFLVDGVAGDLFTLNVTRLSGNADQCARWIEPDGSIGNFICAGTNGTTGLRAPNIALDKRVGKSGTHILQILDNGLDEVFRYSLEVQCIGVCRWDSSLRFSILNAASFTKAIAPGTWISITGSNLSATTRSWQSEDFVAGRLPTSLDGTSVTIDGRRLAISYVSPTQVNALVPPDLGPGAVRLTVTTNLNAGTADVTVQPVAPAFFMLSTEGQQAVAAVHLDGTLVAPAGAIPGVVTRPVRPGETILLFGTGFGPTSPMVPGDAVFSGGAPLLNGEQLRLWIGGITADIRFAGAVANGLYQFNVVVPQVADGNASVIAEIGGRQSPLGPTLAVRR